MKKNKKDDISLFKELLKGIYAGFLIGIGAISYLAIENKIVGSFIFSLGLLTICIMGFNLYTGKIGYVINEKLSYLKVLLMTILGNFIGTNIVGFLIRNTRFTKYIEVAQKLTETKLNDKILSIFILSIFCGVLMYIAVDSFKKSTDVYSKYIPIHLCVMCFILCGFEHCVANMTYFAVAGNYSLKMFLYLLVMILGNSFGSIMFAYFKKGFTK